MTVFLRYMYNYFLSPVTATSIIILLVITALDAFISVIFHHAVFIDIPLLFNTWKDLQQKVNATHCPFKTIKLIILCIIWVVELSWQDACTSLVIRISCCLQISTEVAMDFSSIIFYIPYNANHSNWKSFADAWVTLNLLGIFLQCMHLLKLVFKNFSCVQYFREPFCVLVNMIYACNIMDKKLVHLYMPRFHIYQELAGYPSLIGERLVCKENPLCQPKRLLCCTVASHGQTTWSWLYHK